MIQVKSFEFNRLNCFVYLHMNTYLNTVLGRIFNTDKYDQRTQTIKIPALFII